MKLESPNSPRVPSTAEPVREDD